MKNKWPIALTIYNPFRCKHAHKARCGQLHFKTFCDFKGPKTVLVFYEGDFCISVVVNALHWFEGAGLSCTIEALSAVN